MDLDTLLVNKESKSRVESTLIDPFGLDTAE